MRRSPIWLWMLVVASCANDGDGMPPVDASVNAAQASDAAPLDARVSSAMDAADAVRDAQVVVDAKVEGDATMDAASDASDASDAAADAVDAQSACAAGMAACSGACIDVQSSAQHCGSCDNVCPAGFGCHAAHCQAEVGCSDGSREAFASTARFPTIAGCAATWPLASLRAASTGVACGDTLKQCKVPADACAKGWHVCGGNAKGAEDLTDRISHDECYAEAGRWAIALGDQSCTNCGADSSGAACCGDGCLQQMGVCIWPGATGWWGVVDDVMNSCNAIENTYASVQSGVLCCRS